MPVPDLSALLILLQTCYCPLLFSSFLLRLAAFNFSIISLIIVTLHFVYTFAFLPSVSKTRVKNNVRRETHRHYHLKYIWAFIKIYHSKKYLIGKCTGISPGVCQNLVFLISLPVKHTKWDAASCICPEHKL